MCFVLLLCSISLCLYVLCTGKYRASTIWFILSNGTKKEEKKALESLHSPAFIPNWGCVGCSLHSLVASGPCLTTVFLLPASSTLSNLLIFRESSFCGAVRAPLHNVFPKFLWAGKNKGELITFICSNNKAILAICYLS